jgi:rhamnosyltransferase subunit B
MRGLLMSQKHIVITVMGSLGDLHPMLALGSALKDQGYRVTVASALVYQDRVERAELTFYPLRPELDITDEAKYREVFNRFDGAERLIRRYVLPTVPETLADLKPLLETADFLINATLIFPGPLLARKFHIPWASVTLQPFGYFSVDDPTVLPFASWLDQFRNIGPGLWKFMNVAMHWGSAGWFKNFHQLRKSLCVSYYGHPLFEGQFSSNLNFAFFSPHFAQPQVDWPPHTIATGFPFMDELSTDIHHLPKPIQEFLLAGEPPIIFTLGSSAVRIADDFYNSAVRAIKRLGNRHRALFLIGNNTITESLTNQMIAWDYLPYGQIFGHGSVIVHQGGIGTTAQGLRAGKPMLIIPYGFDQPDNAARAERLGVSQTLSKNKLNDQTLSKALDKLLTDPTYKAVATEFSEKIRSENCFEIVCQYIDNQLI